jgi:Aldo/keto reductase family
MTPFAAETGANTSESRKAHSFANGDRMPLLGLGTWKSDPGDVYAAVREAIRIGYRHIDCASLYGNEPEIGNALRDAVRDGEVTRKDLWITSKLWSNAHGRGNVEPALRKTLKDLGRPEVGHPGTTPRESGGIELTQAELEWIAGLDRGYRLIAGAFWAVEGRPWTLQTIWDGP